MKAGIWQHHMFCGQQIVTILQHRWMIFYWRHTPYSRQLPTLFFSLFQLLKLLLNRRRLVGRLTCPSVLFKKKNVLLCLQPNSHWTRVISQVRALQLRNKKYRSNESSVILFLTSQWASHVFPGLNASFRWEKKLQVDLWWPFPAIVQALETNQLNPKFYDDGVLLQLLLDADFLFFHCTLFFSASQQVRSRKSHIQADFQFGEKYCLDGNGNKTVATCV